jgi:sugar phosphate isomerase/epimerase
MESLTRRSFLKQSSGAIVGAGLVTPLMSCAQTPKRRIDEIGLQVYTIRNALKNDWESTLRQVAAIGYNTLEMGDYYGESVASFKQFLKEINLKVLSGGGNTGELRNGADAVIQKSLEMGKEYVVCFWPWSDSPEGKTLDDWKRLAADLNTIGEKVKKAGLTFAYHNHNLEFKLTDGIIPYDILLDNTDPALVYMEIDLYWIIKGGQMPIPYLKKYPGRFPLWHVKDMDNTPERGFACVGEGIINFPEIFNYAETAGLKHIFVEEDEPKDEMACARVSHDYLQAMRY